MYHEYFLYSLTKNYYYNNDTDKSFERKSYIRLNLMPEWHVVNAFYCSFYETFNTILPFPYDSNGKTLCSKST